MDPIATAERLVRKILFSPVPPRLCPAAAVTVNVRWRRRRAPSNSPSIGKRGIGRRLYRRMYRELTEDGGEYSGGGGGGGSDDVFLHSVLSGVFVFVCRIL